jgi:hypothetical protein
MFFSFKTGPRVSRVRLGNFDDIQDYMDLDIPAGELPAAESGPIVHFLADMPDWMNMTPEDLNLAFESLPIPLEGTIPPGASLQEAIQVNQRHDIP